MMNAAGSTMRIPALFSMWVWFMPSMNEVVVKAVTAYGAGLAIPVDAVAGACCPAADGLVASDVVIAHLPFQIVPRVPRAWHRAQVLVAAGRNRRSPRTASAARTAFSRRDGGAGCLSAA
jgi:hypothetical protein